MIALVGLDKDLLDALGSEVVAIFDPKVFGEVMGIAVIGNDKAWPDWKRRHQNAKALIAIDNPSLRRSLFDYYNDIIGFVSPHAYVSQHAIVHEAAVVQRGVYISADVFVQRGARINVGAQIHHDCTIGQYATIAPHAQLMGRVIVEPEAYIGAGAVVLQSRRIGKGATVGAGAVVTKDIGAGETVMGVPARAA